MAPSWGIFGSFWCQVGQVGAKLGPSWGQVGSKMVKKLRSRGQRYAKIADKAKKEPVWQKKLIINALKMH